jgi:hypothetical protein
VLKKAIWDQYAEAEWRLVRMHDLCDQNLSKDGKISASVSFGIQSYYVGGVAFTNLSYSSIFDEDLIECSRSKYQTFVSLVFVILGGWR